MKKIILAVLFAGAALFGQAQNTLVVDPNATVREVKAEFKAIKVSGGIDLYLSQSDNVAIAVSAAEERYKEFIHTDVEDGTLKIYYEGERFNWKNKRLKVYVSFKTLEKLNASGASDVVVTGTIESASLDMQLSGASDFKGAVKVDKLKMNLSGASNVRISGTARTVDIESSGASDVKGYELVTDYCNATASGASDINITVNKELNAHASGASDINFKGEGLIRDMHASGASSVTRRKG